MANGAPGASLSHRRASVALHIPPVLLDVGAGADPRVVSKRVFHVKLRRILLLGDPAVLRRDLILRKTLPFLRAYRVEAARAAEPTASVSSALLAVA